LFQGARPEVNEEKSHFSDIVLLLLAEDNEHAPSTCFTARPLGTRSSTGRSRLFQTGAIQSSSQLHIFCFKRFVQIVRHPVFVLGKLGEAVF
jgi:hypothetical protein